MKNMLKNLKYTFLTNPIVSKELLLKFRYKRFFWVASLYALVTFAATFFFLSITGGFVKKGYDITRLSELARKAFIFLTFWQFAIITVLTLAFTAASITSEKEQNTLFLLFSSQLDAKMVVIGKFITSALFNMLIILILLPMISIIFILGGISPMEMLYSSALIFLGSLMIVAIAIFWSAVFKSTIMSNILSFFTGFGFIAGPVLFPYLILESIRLRSALSSSYKDISFLAQHINPAFPLLLLFEKARMMKGTVFKQYDYTVFLLSSCLTIILITIILLALSSYILKKKNIKS